RLDEAVGALHRAVDVVEATRGGGGLNIVFSACRELRPWRNVDLVQDVYDRVMTLMTAGGAAAMTVDEKKRAVREHVWALLEEHRAAPAGVHGRIPAFFGAEKAADRLAELPEWQSAKIVKAVPDTAQQPVRARALDEGKLV